MSDKRFLIISASTAQTAASTDPDGARCVLLKLDVSDPQIGLAPGLHLALRFSATEARQIARQLDSMAASIEAGSSPRH